MKIKLLYIIIMFTFLSSSLKADEGMWLINLINKNYEDMRQQGFKLSPQDIYDINKASLKDAVVWFDGYCTGSIISNSGLVLTNYHCGYKFVTNLSNASNVLKKGWYSQSMDEDIHINNLWVGVLKEVKDVSSIIKKRLKEVGSKGYESDINKIKLDIIKEAESQGNHYQAYIKDIFGSSQYILILIERFTDIRLVGVPPEYLGKFGGDKDNWMWPRHTADFSLFRIYANADNNPSKYSSDNVPYHPKHFIKTSLDGYKKGDFSLIAGYPGVTNRYSTSFEIEFENARVYPGIYTIRSIATESWRNEMKKSRASKLQLSNIYQNISNYQKFYLGLRKGIIKFDIINKLKKRENNFINWAGDKKTLHDYEATFNSWKKLYDDYSDIIVWSTYSHEIMSASPVLRMAGKFLSIGRVYMDKDYKLADIMIKSIPTNSLFTDFDYEADKEILPALMLEFWKNTTYDHLPEILDFITEEYGDDALEAFQNYTQEAFLNSIFTSKDRYIEFTKASDLYKERTLLNDPIYKLAEGIIEQYNKDIEPAYNYFQTQNKQYKTEYILGLQQMYPNKLFYPDANLTPRISYGTIQDYNPTDGVEYNYFTTIDGLLEKARTKNEEYMLPEKAIYKFEEANNSKYIDHDGKLHVCFITNNDITGGNSGSPVLNDKLELIGVAFDGNWESITGQVYFDKKYNRSIAVDIRFILWCIDNLAGAENLSNEIIGSS